MEMNKRFFGRAAFITAAFCALLIMLLCTPAPVSAESKASTQTTIKVKINGKYQATMIKKSKGWYLSSKDVRMNKLKSCERMVYLTFSKNKTFSNGYYYFNSSNYLNTWKVFHTVKLENRLNNLRFNGKFYFGDTNGRLRQKSGWITYRGRKYVTNQYGRMCTDRWYRGYYLKSDGQIAKSMKTPDRFYVDADGKKCAQEEMRLSGLRNTLKSMTKSYGGIWSIYVKDLKTGDVININEKAMYPASVIKLFVMEATYNRIKSGKLSKTATVNRLLKEMITVSDNESYNQLVRLNGNGSFVKGCSNINQYLKKCGYTNTGVHSTLHPSSSYYMNDGGVNKASAKDAGVLLEKIYRRQAVSKTYSTEMRNYLLRQTRRWKIPSGIPSGIRVANKTGETSSYQHDSAIVYGKKTNYVVSIFSQTGEYTGTTGIRRLSAKIYDYLN